jgi:hypothetical protein
MTKVLTRAEILEADDRRVESVDVPEWGGSVMVRSLTGTERDQYEATILSMRGTDVKVTLANAHAKLVARACVDDAGTRLFTDDDVTGLGRKNAAALERVYTVAARLSGLSKSDVDEMVKNSDALPSGAFGSD